MQAILYFVLLTIACYAGLELYRKHYHGGLVVGLMALMTAAFGHILLAILLIGTTLATWMSTAIIEVIRRRLQK